MVKGLPQMSEVIDWLIEWGIPIIFMALVFKLDALRKKRKQKRREAESYAEMKADIARRNKWRESI